MVSQASTIDQLASLSAELRVIVYRNVLSPAATVLLGRSIHATLSLDRATRLIPSALNPDDDDDEVERRWRTTVLSLLLVNRSIHQEFAQYLFRETQFCFVDFAIGGDFLSAINIADFNNIRTVYIGNRMQARRHPMLEWEYSKIEAAETALTNFCADISTTLPNLTSLRLQVIITASPDSDFLFPDFETTQPFPTFYPAAMNSLALVRAFSSFRALMKLQNLQNLQIKLSNDFDARGYHMTEHPPSLINRGPTLTPYKNWQRWIALVYAEVEAAIVAIIEGEDAETAWTGYVSMRAMYERFNTTPWTV